MTIDRRTLLKGAAWSLPVIATAVAVPAVSSSVVEPEPKARLVFTNVTATVGPEPNRVYANTRVMVSDGPDPVSNAMLTISTSDGQSKTWTWAELPGWGSAEQVYVEFPVAGTTEVIFRATGESVIPIEQTVTVEKPNWWR